MTRLSRGRSHVNMNNMKAYNLIDAKIDNPHAAMRELRSFLEERGTSPAPLRNRRPLSSFVRTK